MKRSVLSRRSFMTLGGIGTLSLLARPAHGGFPDRLVNFVIPWPPGSGTDVVARALAKETESILGQTVIPINRPGSSTILGMTEVAQAKPDGYTIAMMSSVGFIQAIRRPLQYSADSFDYLVHYADNTMGIVVRRDSPFHTLEQLVEAGRKNPGALKYAVSALGTTQHLMVEAIGVRHKTRFVPIPQTGGSTPLTALLGGHVDFISDPANWMQHALTGELRPLAVSTERRNSQIPEVPTLRELGYDTLRAVNIAIAPRGLDNGVRSALSKALLAAAGSPAMRDIYLRFGMEAVVEPGEIAKQTVKKQSELARQFIEVLGR